MAAQPSTCSVSLLPWCLQFCVADHVLSNLWSLAFSSCLGLRGIWYGETPVWTRFSRLVLSSCTSSLELFGCLSSPVCSYTTTSTNLQKSTSQKTQRCLLVSCAGQPEVQVWLGCCWLLFAQRLGASVLQVCLRASTGWPAQGLTESWTGPDKLPWLPRSSAQPWQQKPNSLSSRC